MMSLAWNEFTPWSALAGGALVGLAAAMFVLLNGRIAGISGVIGGLFKPVKGDVAWRAAFVLGLVGSPWLYALFASLPEPRIGDFLDYRVLSESAGRVDLEIDESTMDEATGTIGSRTRRVIVGWALAADGSVPATVTIAPAE
jgi:hypothetical protein